MNGLVRHLLLSDYHPQNIEATLARIELMHQDMVGGSLPFTPMLRKMQHDVYINHLIDALKDLRGYDLNNRLRRITSLYPTHPVCVSLIEAYDEWGKQEEKESTCCCGVM